MKGNVGNAILFIICQMINISHFQQNNIEKNGPFSIRIIPPEQHYVGVTENAKIIASIGQCWFICKSVRVRALLAINLVLDL